MALSSIYRLLPLRPAHFPTIADTHLHFFVLKGEETAFPTSVFILFAFISMSTWPSLISMDLRARCLRIPNDHSQMRSIIGVFPSVSTLFVLSSMLMPFSRFQMASQAEIEPAAFKSASIILHCWAFTVFDNSINNPSFQATTWQPSSHIQRRGHHPSFQVNDMAPKPHI